MMEEPKVPQDFFKSLCNYYVIGELQEETKTLLKNGGAKENSYLTDMISHVIAEANCDSDEISEARDLYDFPVVSEKWVVLSVKCGVLLPFSVCKPEKDTLFEGITACPSQIDANDACSLWAMITYHGGTWQNKLTKNCTHLITTCRNGAKYDLAVKHPDRISVVSPDWVIDSVSQQKKQPELNYNPKLFILPGDEDTDPQTARKRHREKKKKKKAIPLESAPSTLQELVSQSNDHDFSAEENSLENKILEISSKLCQSDDVIAHFGCLPRENGGELLGSSDSQGDDMMGSVNTNEIKMESPSHLSENDATCGTMDSLGSKSSSKSDQTLSENDQQQPASERSGPRFEFNGPPLGTSNRDPSHIHFSSVTHGGAIPMNRMDGPQSQHMNYQYGANHPHQMPQTAFIGGRPAVPPQPHQLSPNYAMQSSAMRPQLGAGPAGGNSQQTLRGGPVAMCRVSGGGVVQSQPPQRGVTSAPTASAASARFPAGGGGPAYNHQAYAPPPQPGQLFQNSGPPHPHTAAYSSAPGAGAHIYGSSGPYGVGGTMLQRHQRPEHLVPYFGHDPGSHVTPDCCLLGCVFYVTVEDTYLEHDESSAMCLQIIFHGGEISTDYGPSVTHVLIDSQTNKIFEKALADQKRVVTPLWLRDVLRAGVMKPPWSVAHVPRAPFLAGRLVTTSCLETCDADTRSVLRRLLRDAGVVLTTYLCRNTTTVITRSLDSKKAISAMNWQIPLVNVQWLCDAAMGLPEAFRNPRSSKYRNFSAPVDNTSFRLDLNLVSHMMVGWRSPITVSPESLSLFKSRKKNGSLSASVASQVAHLANSPNQNDIGHRSSGMKRKLSMGHDPTVLKQSRMSNGQNISLRPTSSITPRNPHTFIFTEIRSALKTHLLKIVNALGGAVTSNPKEATHCIASKLVRTEKFLCSVNRGLPLLTPEWLQECAREGKFIADDLPMFFTKDLNPSLHELHTPLPYNLVESVKRARKAPLMKGMIFYLTPGLMSLRKLCTAVVECAGGQVIRKRPSARALANRPKHLPQIFVLTNDNDRNCCRDLFMKNIEVYNVELVLTGTLIQRLMFNSFIVKPS